MSPTKMLGALLLCWLVTPSDAYAQRVEPIRFQPVVGAAPRVPLPRLDATEGETSLEAAGSLVGMLGFLFGAAGGMGVGQGVCTGDCQIRAAMIGGAVGASFLVPVGVHSANQSRGALLPAIGGAFGAAVVALGAASLAEPDEFYIIASALALPVQIVLASAIERATAGPEPAARP